MSKRKRSTFKSRSHVHPTPHIRATPTVGDVGALLDATLSMWGALSPRPGMVLKSKKVNVNREL